MSRPAVVVLAAGRSTRMKTDLPKVLHELAGKTLLDHVLDLAGGLKAGRVIVIAGHKYKAVEEHLKTNYKGMKGLKIVKQEPQLGTGHAVRKALPSLRGHVGPVLVLSGDVPLLQKSTIQNLIKSHRREKVGVSFLSMVLPDGGSYGRVIKTTGKRVSAIVEALDANDEQRAVTEVNAGIYCFDLSFLRKAAKKLGKDNSQGEFYLTDTVETAHETGAGAIAERCDFEEALGINDRKDFAAVGALLQKRINERLFSEGVTLTHPRSVVIHPGVKVGRDTVIGFGVHLLGETVIGAGCRIDAGSYLNDTSVEDGVWVKPYTVTDGARIRTQAQVGPFSHLRPGADVGVRAKTGNFVEMKKAVLHEGVKANHLSYLGDCEIGERTNVGAGTITCNYDGVNKHFTSIGADVMIGSDTQLVAPVIIGDEAYIGAGTTVLKDVPEGCLALNPKTQSHRAIKSSKKKKTKKKGSQRKGAQRGGAKKKGAKKKGSTHHS